MRERGKERVRGVRDGRRSRARQSILNQERAGSRGRSRLRRRETEEQRQRQHDQNWAQQWQKEGQRPYNQNQARQWQKEGLYDKGLYKQATPFFFSNFPDDWGYADMWKTFVKFGRVYDIYSPKRRSKNGSRFGFVRFLEVKNIEELEMQLDQIRVGGQKLWVNTPRYNDMKGGGGEQKKYHETKPNIQDRSYAEVVKGMQERRLIEGSKPMINQDRERRPVRSRIRTESGHRRSGIRKVWQERGQGENWARIEYNVKPEDCAWLKGCYVGMVHSVGMVRNLQEKFYMKGYFPCRIRAMGGKLVLLDCEDEDELKDLVEMASDWLNQWFENVRPWTPEAVAKERFVWLRCQGAPLNVWGPEFFEKMASSWGKFICLDDNTSKRMRFDIARFLISTPIKNTISVLRQIKVNGIIYNMKFSEEEFTNSFFSLKQDFLPAFQSDSEEHETWSTESEWENQEADIAEVNEQAYGNNTQVEDDDVAQGQEREKVKFRKQARREKEKLVVTMEDSLEHFQILNETETRIGVEKEVQIQRFAAMSGKRDEVEGEQLGRSEQPRRKQGDIHLGLEEQSSVNQDGKPNTHIEKSDGEESTNAGWTQSQKKTENNNPAIIEDSSGSKEAAFVTKGTEDKDPFWRGYEREQGCIEEWLSRRAGESSKKKKRKIKLYRSVPNGKIAGGSMGDNGIQNCNRGLKKQMQNQLAKDIWDLAKQLGAVAEDDKEIIQRIEEMENRDSRAKSVMENHGSGSEKKIRELIKKEKVEFLTIQETKLQAVDSRICRGVWGSEDMEWISKPLMGLLGGLLCIWNPKVLKMIEVIEGNNFIGVYGVWGEKKIPVHILNIHSPCQLVGKRALWKELQCLVSSRNGNWCLTGDFNAIRSIEERAGCRGMSAEMREFEEFIHSADLIDLPLVGRKYTWYNSNGQYMSRIDRFLISEGWLSNWGDVKQWGLRRSVSDHCPVLLKDEKIDWGPKSFKFFDAWLEQLGCKETIRKAWNSSEVYGGNEFKLKEKLKITKKALKEWSNNSIADVDSKIRESEKMIAVIDEQGERSTLTNSDVEKRRNCFLDL
ncbi:hypothetical protein SLEP1_g45280 [Rubroshorea leprosula]|uniref:RRM domain-containing protein n=1 Tax=Rubroshorea leprosula TaxID=152421 RepID=A0AAV5LIK8_9ROSI|nr:hypothetical protein SLEP1_g45280 [Rubroshorea leprosula]